MATTFNEIQQPPLTVDEAPRAVAGRVFRGINQNPQTSARTILDDFAADKGIRRYTIYQGPDGRLEPQLRCQAIACQQQENMVEWLVRCTYMSESAFAAPGSATPWRQRERAQLARDFAPGGGTQQPPTDPTEIGFRIRFTGQEYEEPFTKDALTGREVMNALKERPVPPPTRPRSFRVVTLEVNQLFFLSDFTHQFENTVNENVWYGYQPRTVLCKRIDADSDYQAGVAFSRVAYVFWVKRQAWMYSLLQQSLNYRTAPIEDGGVITAFKDEKTGEPLNTPRLIRSDGTALGDDEEPEYQEYNMYPQMNFSLLGIGG